MPTLEERVAGLETAVTALAETLKAGQEQLAGAVELLKDLVSTLSPLADSVRTLADAQGQLISVVRTLAEADWAHAWKEHFKPHRVGPFVITPPWAALPAPADGLPVVIDPGLAFGTGLHPTTQLCLELAAELVRPGETVLDLGTGSGILAIAAARLGAGQVLALDIDPLAVKAARANVRRNRLSRQVKVVRGTLKGPTGPFGLILANLSAPVLTELAPAIAASLASGGRLVASGLLVGRADDLERLYAGLGLESLDRRTSGDWAALVLGRGQG